MWIPYSKPGLVLYTPINCMPHLPQFWVENLIRNSPGGGVFDTEHMPNKVCKRKVQQNKLFWCEYRRHNLDQIPTSTSGPRVHGTLLPESGALSNPHPIDIPTFTQVGQGAVPHSSLMILKLPDTKQGWGY